MGRRSRCCARENGRGRFEDLRWREAEICCEWLARLLRGEMEVFLGGLHDVVIDHDAVLDARGLARRDEVVADLYFSRAKQGGLAAAFDAERVHVNFLEIDARLVKLFARASGVELEIRKSFVHVRVFGHIFIGHGWEKGDDRGTVYDDQRAFWSRIESRACETQHEQQADERAEFHSRKF